MSVIITPQGVKVNDTLYPAGSVMLSVSGLKVSVIHTYTLQHLISEYVPFGSVVNETTGLGYATIADLQTAFASENSQIIDGNI
jgi:hypothetical protein